MDTQHRYKWYCRKCMKFTGYHNTNKIPWKRCRCDGCTHEHKCFQNENFIASKCACGSCDCTIMMTANDMDKYGNVCENCTNTCSVKFKEHLLSLKIEKEDNNCSTEWYKYTYK